MEKKKNGNIKILSLYLKKIDDKNRLGHPATQTKGAKTHTLSLFSNLILTPRTLSIIPQVLVVGKGDVPGVGRGRSNKREQEGHCKCRACEE